MQLIYCRWSLLYLLRANSVIVEIKIFVNWQIIILLNIRPIYTKMEAVMKQLKLKIENWSSKRETEQLLSFGIVNFGNVHLGRSNKVLNYIDWMKFLFC